MFEKERGNELSKKFLHSLSETYGSRLTRTRYDMLQHNHVVQKKGVRVFSFFFPLDVEIGQGVFFFFVLCNTAHHAERVATQVTSTCVYVSACACFRLHVTYLLIDHSVPRSAGVSMPTQPVARQKMRTHSVQETTASVCCSCYLACFLKPILYTERQKREELEGISSDIPQPPPLPSPSCHVM